MKQDRRLSVGHSDSRRLCSRYLVSQRVLTQIARLSILFECIVFIYETPDTAATYSQRREAATLTRHNATEYVGAKQIVRVIACGLPLRLNRRRGRLAVLICWRCFACRGRHLVCHLAVDKKPSRDRNFMSWFSLML